MIFLHATPGKNIRSILRQGLKVGRAKCVKKSIWLVASRMHGEAIRHAAKRHREHPTRIVVLEIDVPRAWLRKGRKRGYWHTNGRSICPARIRFLNATVRVQADQSTYATA